MPTLQDVFNNAPTGQLVKVPTDTQMVPKAVLRRPVKLDFAGLKLDLKAVRAKEFGISCQSGSNGGELSNLELFGIDRVEGDPMGDPDWPVAIEMLAGNKITTRNMTFRDIEGVCIDDFAGSRHYNHLMERIGGGIRWRDVSGGLAKDCLIGTLPHMLRNTQGGSDDCGAMGFMIHGTPHNPAARNVIDGCAVFEANAPSFDYGTDGGGIEVYEAASLHVKNTVLLNCNSMTESGSKGPQVRDLLWEDNILVSISDPTKGLRVGVMMRPQMDVTWRRNRISIGDHWNFDINQGSATFAVGQNANIQIVDNLIIGLTAQSLAYNRQGSGWIIDRNRHRLADGVAYVQAGGVRYQSKAGVPSWCGVGAGEVIERPGTAVVKAERDALYAEGLARIAALRPLVGVKVGTTPTPIPEDEVTAAELEAALKPIRDSLAGLEGRVAALEPLHALHDQPLDFAGFDAAMANLSNTNRAKAVLAEAKKLLMPQRR